jgi:hypothetical protein
LNKFTLDEANAAKAKLVAEFQDKDAFNGAELQGSDVDGWIVKALLRDSSLVMWLPVRIDGVPVSWDVVGSIRAPESDPNNEGA